MPDLWSSDEAHTDHTGGAPMKRRVRALIDYGKQCGFTVAGQDGSEHYVLEHPNGSRIRVASTPSDYRGDENNRALMRRLSGVTPPRPRAGHYRKGVRRDEYVPASERVESVSAQYARQAREHRKLCDRVAWLQTEARCASTERDVIAALADLDAVEDRIRLLGRPVPHRTFRTIPEGSRR